MKIGIFGGSFNPPHNMHKNIALNLIEKGYLDKIIYVPTGNNYKKNGLINFIDRYKMVELMIKGYNKLSVSDIGNNNGYKYTYQTLDYYKSIYKDEEIYFICGTDNLNEFDTWMEYKYILNNYKLLVIRRNNDDIESILNKYEEYKRNIVVTTIVPEILSSTYIRNNIKSIEIKKYLNDRVYEYIIENKLYER